MVVTRRTYHVYSVELAEEEYQALRQALIHLRRGTLPADMAERRAIDGLHDAIVSSEPIEAVVRER